MKLFHYSGDILNDICLAVKSNNLVILKQSNFMFIQKFTCFIIGKIYKTFLVLWKPFSE